MKVSAARQNDFSVLPKPKNDRADVLLTLINNGNASIEDFPKLSGFRTRISELHVKYGLELIYQPVKGTNRHGNTITYRRHILPEYEKETAIELYHKINA